MKYFLLVFFLVCSGCSLRYNNSVYINNNSGESTKAWIELGAENTGNEKFLNKELVFFVPNYPLISGDVFDPDGDGKTPGLLLNVKREDLGIQFQYIYDLSHYYYTTGISLDEYIKSIDLNGFSKELFNPKKGGIELITGDRNNRLYVGCSLKPKIDRFFDYDNNPSIYRPIQTLIHRESYGPGDEEYKKCEDKNAELYINWELWALDDTFAIRLPQCGIGCAPGPDFRRAATIRPIKKI